MKKVTQQLSLMGIPEAPPVTLSDLHVVAAKVTEAGRLTATLEGTVTGETGTQFRDLACLNGEVWAKALMIWAMQIRQDPQLIRE